MKRQRYQTVMKYIFPYLLLLAGLPAFAQKNTSLKINITSDHSRKQYIYRLKPDTIRFYQLPADTLAFKATAGEFDQSFNITRIPVGTYRVTYRNLFMETSTRQITLQDTRLNEISLCIDTLDSYPHNTLAQLQDKDSIFIDFSSSGCDGFSKHTISITRNNDQFVAIGTSTYFDRSQVLNESYKGDTPVIHTVTLTGQHIKEWVKFENELRAIKPFGNTTIIGNHVLVIEQICTTTDTYHVKSNYFNLDKSYNGCRWHGYYGLAQALFGSPF